MFFSEDSLAFHNGANFSTYDQDNDIVDGVHCAAHYKGAWWMYACFASSLNGPYSPTAEVPHGEGIMWAFNIGGTKSLQFTEMKICR